jgi:hypothetical protein
VGATVLLVCWGLVAAGIVLVAAALLMVGARLRPLRRALRKLFWRRAEVERVLAHAEAVRERIGVLTAQLSALSEFTKVSRRSPAV